MDFLSFSLIWFSFFKVFGKENKAVKPVSATCVISTGSAIAVSATCVISAGSAFATCTN